MWRTWRGIVAAAIVIEGLITFSVVYIATVGQPLLISSESIAAVNGWATYANTLLTALLLGAAIFAWNSSQEQIQQTERHFRAAQAMSMKPLLSLPSVVFVNRFNSIDVIVKNVGLGPAVEVEIAAWAYPYDPNRPPLEQFGEVRERHDPDSPPHLRKPVGPIGSNDQLGPITLIDIPPFTTDELREVGGRGALVFRLNYKDVYGAEFSESGIASFISSADRRAIAID